jgi:pyrroloquinoline quinone biosynthesis protein D
VLINESYCSEKFTGVAERPGMNAYAQNAHVLLYPDGMVRLNESAGAVLNEVDGQRSVEDIVETLEKKLPEARSMMTDVWYVLKAAEQKSWIEIRSHQVVSVKGPHAEVGPPFLAIGRVDVSLSASVCLLFQASGFCQHAERTEH